ncbi:MAG: hypothetical protein CHACPFDD_00031 [Phycisphaerae bacterium]|nr:hypothetical protein [Phycisphaerae bacterium]
MYPGGVGSQRPGAAGAGAKMYVGGMEIAVPCDMQVRCGRFEREFRVLTLALAIAVLHAGDLTLTLAESETRLFAESNPLAAALVGGPAWGLVAFKLGLLGAGVATLLTFRRRAEAETAAWVILAVTVALMLWWQQYYHYSEHCLVDFVSDMHPPPTLETSTTLP